MCLGRTHALSGAAAGVAVGGWVLHERPAPLALFAATTAGYALVNDIDHCDATIARSMGFLTEAFAQFVRAVSGGHRHGTHSIAGVAAFSAAALLARTFDGTWPGRIVLGLFLAIAFAGALRALHLGGHFADLLAVAGAAAMVRTGYGLSVVAVAAALGTAVHITGDMLTVEGCPLWWPLRRAHWYLLPPGMRFTTGHAAERWLIAPALLAALAALAAWDTGIAALAMSAYHHALAPAAQR
jgi:membrane-bound metal-dependent hydrolase YbcI (DUF457 family)